MDLLSQILIMGKRKIILPLFFFLCLAWFNSLQAQQVRDVYVPEFTMILNDSVSQKEFFEIVDQYAINRITLPRLYNFYNHPYLTAFLDKCWKRGIREISGGLPVAFMDAPNFEQKAFSPLISSYTYEREWWNDSVNSSPQKDLAQLQKLRRQNNNLSFSIYFGWFGTNQDKDMLALTAANTFENILIHHYRDRPDFNYIKERLLIFAKAASRYRKEQNVIVRISVEDRFIQNITPKKMGNFFDQIMKDFELAKRQNPDLRFIKIKGWQIYNYNFLRK